MGEGCASRRAEAGIDNGTICQDLHIETPIIAVAAGDLCAVLMMISSGIPEKIHAQLTAICAITLMRIKNLCDSCTNGPNS